jgi:hypothetical protein
MGGKAAQNFLCFVFFPSTMEEDMLGQHKKRGGGHVVPVKRPVPGTPSEIAISHHVSNLLVFFESSARKAS